MRTAETAITGIFAGTMVRFGPSNVKFAPQASARDPTCMTASWGRSEYAKTTSSTASSRQSASRRSSGTIGMPVGYRGPASVAG